MGWAELVGGPIDGTRFEVSEPAPPFWRRYASFALPGGAMPLPDPGRPDDGVTVVDQRTEHYVRDLHPRADGTWLYRWRGYR